MTVGNICHLTQVCLYLLSACNQPAWLSHSTAAFPIACCSCLAAAPAHRRQILPLIFLLLPGSRLPGRSHPAVIPSLCFLAAQFSDPAPFQLVPPSLSPLCSPPRLPSPCPRGALARPFGNPAGQAVVGQLGWGATPSCTHECLGTTAPSRGRHPWNSARPGSRGWGRAAPSSHTSVETACARRTPGKGEVPAIVPGTAQHGSRGFVAIPPAPRPRTLRTPGPAPPSPRREAPGAPRSCPEPPAGQEAPAAPPSPALSAKSPQTAPRDGPEQPHAGSLRGISPNPPHFRPQERRGARRAGHGTGTSGPPRAPSRGATCEAQEDDPSQDVPIHLASGAGGGRGAGAAPLRQPPPLRAGRAGGAAAP